MLKFTVKSIRTAFCYFHTHMARCSRFETITINQRILVLVKITIRRTIFVLIRITLIALQIIGQTELRTDFQLIFSYGSTNQSKYIYLSLQKDTKYRLLGRGKRTSCSSVVFLVWVCLLFFNDVQTVLSMSTKKQLINYSNILFLLYYFVYCSIQPFIARRLD